MRSLSLTQIRQILKKYSLTTKQRQNMQTILQTKLVKVLPIRSYLFHQKSSGTIGFMILKGIVQIFHSQQNNQKLFFSEIGSYEFANEEIVLNQINKYNATVKTSQVQYIELNIQEMNLLLNDQLSMLQSREKRRQNQIDQKVRIRQESKQKVKKQNFMNKLSLPNLKLKNLTPIGEALEMYNPNFNRQVHHANFSRKDRINSDLQKEFVSKQMMRYRTETLQQIANPELHIQDQNQKILQKFRSRNIYKSLDKLSQEKGIKAHIKLSTHQQMKDRLFKQQLKNIIKRKLKYEQKHGRILKAFLYGEEQNVKKYQAKLHKNEIIDNYFNI